MSSDTDSPGFDGARLHAVVSDAVEDAILGAIGTVLLVGVATVLLAIAGATLIQATSFDDAAVGIVFGLLGAYLFAATLGLIPPAREWFWRADSGRPATPSGTTGPATPRYASDRPSRSR